MSFLRTHVCGLLSLMLALLVSCCSPPEATEPPSPSKSQQTPSGPIIGTATMRKDGTIELQLRAESDGGIKGDALITYLPGDAQYDEVLKHLGGLKKGESKPVPPWPEKKE